MFTYVLRKHLEGRGQKFPKCALHKVLNSSCSSQFESLFHPKLTKNVKNGVLTLFSMWKLVVKSKSAQRPLGVSYDKKMSKYKILRRNFDGS